MRAEDESFRPLTVVALQQLREIVAAMTSHSGTWGEWSGGEQEAPSVYTWPYMETDEVAMAGMQWLYDNDRIITFNWPEWREGRAIFANWSAETASTLDHETVCRLLTAIARNERFCDGAWVEMFEDGFGVPLFSRLLEWEEEREPGDGV